MSITAGGVNLAQWPCHQLNTTGLFTSDISGYTRVFHNSTITNSGTIGLQSAALAARVGRVGPR